MSVMMTSNEKLIFIKLHRKKKYTQIQNEDEEIINDAHKEHCWCSLEE